MVDSSKNSNLSRRKMLALTLTGATASVAGCSGGNQDDGTTTAGGTTSGGTTGNDTGGTPTESGLSPDQMAESVVETSMEYLPQDANWNRFSTGPLTAFFNWDYLARTFWNNSTDYMLLKEDGFSYDSNSKTITYELKEDYSYWWNGEPVTGEDWYVQNELVRLLDPQGNPYESWKLEDKYTVKATLKNQINPVLLGTLGPKVSARAMDYRGFWRKWLKKFQNVSGDTERQSLTKELTQMEITTKEYANKGLGNGVYKLTDWNTQEMIWERHEKHPHADQVPFPEVRFRVGKGSAVNQMITNDRLDFGVNQFPSKLESASPKHLETIFEKKSIQSRNILFNYKNKHIGRRNVRRALVSILDFTRLKDFWNGPGGFTKEYQTGLPKALEDKWLGSDFMDKVHKYPVKSDAQRANEFMKQAGYSKKGGRWVGPDGDPLQFKLLIGTYGTQEALGKAMTQVWNQWGAKAELVAEDNSTWVSKINSGEGWGTTIWLHGYDDLDPMNYYNYNNAYHMRLANNASQVHTWLKEGKTHSEINGRPITPKIPKQPGLDVKGNGQKINIAELVDELQVTQKEQRTREIVQTLATYWNYDLPIYDMFPQISAMWGDTKNFSWPKDADIWYQKGSRAMYLTWRKGLVQPVEKQ